MASLREQIVARIVAVLLNATPAGANVYRSREVAITKGLTPAIVVMPDGEDSQRMGSSAERHELTVIVAIFVRGDPWDQLADPVAVAVHQVLMARGAMGDITADVFKTGAGYEGEEADRTAGTLSTRYRITYLTRPGDMTTAP